MPAQTLDGRAVPPVPRGASAGTSLNPTVVMGVYTEENTLIACFRVAEDSTYSDAQDELFTLPAGNIGIPHVLEISPESAAAFGQIYTDYEQLPPFRQLDRGYYHLADNERDSHELIRWQGRLCQSRAHCRAGTPRLATSGRKRQRLRDAQIYSLWRSRT